MINNDALFPFIGTESVFVICFAGTSLKSKKQSEICKKNNYFVRVLLYSL